MIGIWYYNLFVYVNQIRMNQKIKKSKKRNEKKKNKPKQKTFVYEATSVTKKHS